MQSKQQRALGESAARKRISNTSTEISQTTEPNIKDIHPPAKQADGQSRDADKRKPSHLPCCCRVRASSSRIIRITSSRRFSVRAFSASFSRRRSSCVANHCSRARSSSSGLAWATMHEFMARRCERQTHVAVTVRFTAHSAKAGDWLAIYHSSLV